MKWIRLLITTILLPILLCTIPVQAATSGDVIVTATGYVCEAPGGFTVTYFSDYEVGLSWTMGADAVKTLVRGAIGREPVSRADGYLVYYGEDTNATDWVNMETLSVPIYYKAWSENASGVWEEQGGTTGFVEGVSMLLIAFIALALGLFGIAVHFRKQPLAIGAGMAWVGLAVYSLTRATGTFDIWRLLFWLGIAMALCSFFLTWWMREKREPEEILDEGEEYASALRMRAGLVKQGMRARKESRKQGRFGETGEE